VRALLALTLLLGAGPAAAQSGRVAFTCTTEASGAGLTARTERNLDRRGQLRGGVTIVTLPLTGSTGTLQASWDVVRGLPEVARGRYVFRLPAASNATWQLAGAAKPVRAKDGLLTVSGEQFSALLGRGAPIRLVLAGRDGRERAAATLDRAAFDAALDLARQADARGLATSSDTRSCQRSGRP
jgi:hypothetical protein